MTDDAFSPADPRGTVHFQIARALTRRSVGKRTTGGPFGDSWLAFGATADDVDARHAYALQVGAAWGVIGFGFLVAMGAVGVPVQALAGDGAGDVVFNVCLAAGMFCLAGCANVLWRSYWFIPKARRLARRGETDGEDYARAMRRTVPRNSSLVFQALVGILTFLAAM